MVCLLYEFARLLLMSEKVDDHMKVVIAEVGLGSGSASRERGGGAGLRVTSLVRRGLRCNIYLVVRAANASPKYYRKLIQEKQLPLKRSCQ